MMMLAAESFSFAVEQSELRRFVLDPARTLAPRFRILAFLVPDRPESGTLQRFHTRGDVFGRGLGLSAGEVSMYPFGFVFLSEAGYGYDFRRFTDVTDWFRRGSPEDRRNIAVALHTRITGIDRRPSERASSTSHGDGCFWRLHQQRNKGWRHRAYEFIPR